MDDRLRLQRLLRDNCTQEPEDAIGHLLALLNKENGPWPFGDLIRSYQSLWKGLPVAVRDGSDSEWNTTIDLLKLRLKHFAPHMENPLHHKSLRPALNNTEANQEISHAVLHEFVKHFDLGLACSASRKPRVMVILPNSPLLALAVLAVANRYTLVPMAKAVTAEQLKMDIKAVEADAVLMLEADVPKFRIESEIATFIVKPQDNLIFRVSRWADASSSTIARLRPNGPDDLAVILFTSGTSGTKKLVPITTFNLLASIIFTMDSLGLQDTSSCLNMMPLHHV